jgi:ketosteroid isomerase-like protein
MSFDPIEFTRHWIRDWSNKDVDAVLSHFRDDAVFVSPKAALIAGSAELRGKAALRDYWMKARERIQSIRFTLDYHAWDADTRTLTIAYVAELDQDRKRAVEILRFDGEGRVRAGEALYGAAL